MRKKVLVILGPTATGKSHCAVEIAKKIGGEIISGDSMLVYRGMNIGTAKPSADELRAVPHHLVNILPPEAEFNVVDFKNQAERLITEITDRGKLPIIAGGTGLYIKALLENYTFNKADKVSAVRQELEEFLQSQGKEALYERLCRLDQKAAANIHMNNTRRVIRAIESALQGETVSQSNSGELVYDALVFGLNMQRDALYQRINERVDLMLQQGLEAEVRQLLQQGVPAACQSMQSIGYRQMVWYLQGDMTYEQAVDKLKQATRNFAKRQLTWFRKMPYINWLQLEMQHDYPAVITAMCAKINERFLVR